MSTARRLALAAALALAAPAARAAPSGQGAPPAPTPALLARGAAAYARHCLPCHGPKGEADGPAAAALKDKPFNLARQRLPPAVVFTAITEGIPGTPMPSFARLPEEARWAIAHHVEGLGAPRPANGAASVAPSTAPGATAPPAPAGEDVAWIWPGAALPTPAPAALAVLTETIELGAGGPVRRPRPAPLAVGAGTRLTPVVHVQPAPGLDRLDPAAAEVVVGAVVRAARQGTSGWVQLDFEAPTALRQAWRDLVAEARRALPAGTRLSVTAIASWCGGGAWLDGLAADEVVPMLYALGPGAARWVRAFEVGDAALHPRCREGAAGFSVEAPPAAPLHRRTLRRYWFHERPQRPWALPALPPSPSTEEAP